MKGQPTKYNPELEKQICKLLATGKHNIMQVCEAVGISDSTYYIWQNENPAFAAAVKDAQEKRLKAIGEIALSGLTKLLDVYEYEETHTEYEGSKANKKIKSQRTVKKFIMPNTAAVIHTLVNRLPESFKNSQYIDHTTNGKEINKNVLDLSKLTDEELDYLEYLQNKASVKQEEPKQ